MEKVLKGRAWVCGDFTDSYQILPSNYWMGGDAIGNLDPNELGRHVMEKVDPSFAQDARDGKYQFIVGGKNFGGGGKSIEHPIIAIKGSGIKVVIADSASRYFFRNAINNGLPMVTLGGISHKVSTGDELEVNLETGQIKNLTTGENFETPPLPDMIMAIIEKDGYINYTKEKLQAADA